MTPLADRIAAILADTDPAMKIATEFPVLMNRIRVTLDGEDVTRRCRGFSIPLQRVELYQEEEGKKVMQVRCGCGMTTNPERVRQARYQPVCQVCHGDYEWSAATETRIGKVEVVLA